MKFEHFIEKFVIPTLFDYNRIFHHEKVFNTISNCELFKENLNISSKSFIHESAYIHKNSNIINSYIGKDVKVYEGATVRDSIILDDTTIGHSSEVARSIILKNCEISRFNYIGSSLIGENVIFIAGAAIATLRYDRKKIMLNGGEYNWETGLDKFGSIIGSNSTIGYYTKINPGIIIGEKVLIDGHLNINEFIPPKSTVYSEKKLIIKKEENLR